MCKYNSPIWGLDYVTLIVFGINLFTDEAKSKLTHMSLEVFQLIIVTSNVYQSIILIFYYIDLFQTRQTQTILDLITDVIFDSNGLVFFYYTLYQRKKIVNLLKQLSEQLKENELKLLQKSSFIFSLFAIISSLISTVFIDLYCYHSIPSLTQLRTIGFTFDHKLHPNIYKILLVIMTLAMIQRIWLLITPAIYCLIIWSYFYIWKRKIERVKFQFFTVRHKEQMILLEEIRSELNDFEKIFSIYPFLWLNYIFFSATGLLIHISTFASDDLFYTISFSVFRLSLLITIILSILFISSVKNNLTYEKIDLANFIQQQTPSASNLIYLNKIDSLINSVNFTVGSFVVIDKSFLPSYFGSTIAFAALFTQIQLQFGKNS